jgi:hypothetical protein
MAITINIVANALPTVTAAHICFGYVRSVVRLKDMVAEVSYLSCLTHVSVK